MIYQIVADGLQAHSILVLSVLLYTNAFKFECLSYSDGEGGGRTRGPDREAEDQSLQGGTTVGRGEHAYGQVMEW